MREAIQEADNTDPDIRLTALRWATETYAGHPAEGMDYEWVEPCREATRQQALDPFCALADLLAEHVAVLDSATRHNPYAETLYQTAMWAWAALGQAYAIRTPRRNLTRALAEIDAEPTASPWPTTSPPPCNTPRPARPTLGAPQRR